MTELNRLANLNKFVRQIKKSSDKRCSRVISKFEPWSAE